MPKPSNDALVQRHKELRSTLIIKHSRLAAERIAHNECEFVLEFVPLRPEIRALSRSS